MVFMVVIPTFDPLWHGDTVGTDLRDHQHTNTTKELTHKHKDQQIQLIVEPQQGFWPLSNFAPKTDIIVFSSCNLQS